MKMEKIEEMEDELEKDYNNIKKYIKKTPMVIKSGNSEI